MAFVGNLVSYLWAKSETKSVTMDTTFALIVKISPSNPFYVARWVHHRGYIAWHYGYNAMVLHGIENYIKVTASCDQGALAYDIIQYNHDALRLDTVQKGLNHKKITSQIHFVLKF
jgi:hypothetical protein